jgi:hypothetical protein
VPVAEPEDAPTTLAGHLNAATCRFLVLLGSAWTARERHAGGELAERQQHVPAGTPPPQPPGPGSRPAHAGHGWAASDGFGQNRARTASPCAGRSSAAASATIRSATAASAAASYSTT